MVTAYPQASPKLPDEWRDVETSPYLKFSDERKLRLAGLLKDESGAKILKFHQSLCPGCAEEAKWSGLLVDAVTFEKGGKVWMKKRCNEHGVFKEVIWSDWDLYKKAEQFQDPGIQLKNPHIEKSKVNCPMDCGLCKDHESHTGLGNIVVTNRCDLSCWYCFFYSKEGEPIYEPTMDQIRFMLRRMKNEKPVGANSVQLTGGEPTLREDLIDIIKAAREIGYSHIQLNTNGINLAKKDGYTQQLREAGISSLYMSFDGLTPQSNPKNYWEAPKALENCRKAGIGVVLVPTVIGGINDHELGDMVRFASANMDVVRSVNFQPVSLVGRMPEKMRMRQRITIPGTIKKLEEQTDGMVNKEDWFTIPCTKGVTDFVEAVKQKPKYRLSVHFSCGMGTYVFKDDSGKGLIPITRFFDVPGFFEYLGQMTEELNSARFKSVRKTYVLSRLLLNIRRFVDNKNKPKYLRLAKLLTGAIGGGDYSGLGEFHRNSLFLGMMHFQDPYNWDIDRIHKCDIHYAVPDGRVLPFCVFNVIPGLYRDPIQRKYSISPGEWEKKTGKKLADDKHRRNVRPEELEEIKKRYDPHRRWKTKPTLWTDWGDESSEASKAEATAPAKASAGAKHPAGGCGAC
ncbi:MAG: radical SAM protein [Candidatus Aenigmarchaeota archaeon]|nr:radical SAM protein [Candidatus Aenigmarchaeota archaeon]